MINGAETPSLQGWLACAGSRLFLAFVLVMGLAAWGRADDGAKPDPAGTATGDKNSAVDAAGNPFVVPEPTD